MNRPIITSLVLLALLPGISPAGTVSIIADRDNTLFEDPAGSTSNGSGQWLFAGVTAMNSIRRAALRFDVASAVPAGSTITSVQLRLTMDRGGSSPLFMSFHRIAADWGESTSIAFGQQGAGGPAAPGDATWLHRSSPNLAVEPPVPPVFWSNPGGDFEPLASSVLAVGDVGPWTWPSTQRFVTDVQSMLDSPASNFGFMLLGDELSVPPTAKRFFTRETALVADRPTLIVTYIPAPGLGSAALLLAGAMLNTRRRRPILRG